MLRVRGRNAGSSVGSSSPLPTTVSSTTGRRVKKGSRGGGNNNNNSGPSDQAFKIMIGIALILFVVAYFLPAPAPIAKLERAAQDEIHELWNEFHDVHGLQPPVPEHEHDPEWHNKNGQVGGGQDDATNAARPPPAKSSVTGASWVEGEQLLKKELMKLADRQAKGLDIGVPVLTRWLGPDVPAWPTDLSDQGKAAWQTLVDAKYDAMREEEKEWQKKMTAYLQTSSRG